MQYLYLVNVFHLILLLLYYSIYLLYLFLIRPCSSVIVFQGPQWNKRFVSSFVYNVVDTMYLTCLDCLYFMYKYSVLCCDILNRSKSICLFYIVYFKNKSEETLYILNPHFKVQKADNQTSYLSQRGVLVEWNCFHC